MRSPSACSRSKCWVLGTYFHIVIGLLKAAGRTLAAPRFCGSFLNDFDGFAGMAADSDEVARAFRDDVARDYEMMSPGSAPR